MAKSFMDIFGRALPEPRQKPRVREVQKITYSPTWNYVRERLIDPRGCEPGQFRIKVLSPQRAKNVKGVICCPKGSVLRKGEGCFDKETGDRVASVLQAMLHDARKYRFRHPRIWKALLQAPVTKERGSMVHTLKAGKIPVEPKALLSDVDANLESPTDAVWVKKTLVKLRQMGPEYAKVAMSHMAPEQIEALRNSGKKNIISGLASLMGVLSSLSTIRRSVGW